VTTLRAKNVEN